MSSLWESISSSGPAAGAFHGRLGSVALQELAAGSILGGALESFRGRSVLLSMREQLSTALALLELDGVARRLVLCTPDLTPEQLAGVGATAEADIILDSVAAQPLPATLQRRATETTEWILLTSGTTGVPKLVVHSFESLAGALPRHPPSTKPMVWSTFYDIRRYGGLQIYLRAVLSGSPLVLSNAGEPTGEFLARAGAAGVTHISGTPSHWRRALMSGEDGYVDTGDLVELANGRYYFRGRKGGVINVGGLKVFPEEVESVLNADPRVRMSLVKARRNPLTGSLVVAEVVLADSESSADASMAAQIKSDLLGACRRTLAAHKVPAQLRFVPALEMSGAGKLVRPSA